VRIHVFPAGAGTRGQIHHAILNFTFHSKRETKSMKRTVTLLGLSLMLLATVAFAQRPMDDNNERAVRITQGPNITNITGKSANMHWTTNSNGANHVRYRVAGSNSSWQSAYHQGGGTSHSLQLTGLEPGRTYEWQILTRDGDLRTSGQFQTARKRHGHMADVNGGTYPGSGSSDRDHDADDRGYGGDRGQGDMVPLYRSANRNGSLHLYTTNLSEQTSHGYRAESHAGFLMSSQGRDTVPLFRLVGRNGDILHTTDENDRATMQSRYGYRDEGILGYVASSQRSGTEPFYRLVNQDGSAHFYTTSVNERSQFLGMGWKDESYVGYLWLQQ
jgi:hypothetical protein